VRQALAEEHVVLQDAGIAMLESAQQDFFRSMLHCTIEKKGK